MSPVAWEYILGNVSVRVDVWVLSYLRCEDVHLMSTEIASEST